MIEHRLTPDLDILSLDPEQVIAGDDRLRSIDPEQVNALADSIEKHGQLNPILVYEVGRKSSETRKQREKDPPVYQLAAGLHRLEAVRQINRDREEDERLWIDCRVITGVWADGTVDPVAGQVAEIVENLHRFDLTPDQRREHVRRYADLIRQQQEEYAK